MGVRFTRNPDGEAVLQIPLDDLTVARLMEVADVCHAPPELVAASILHDVLEDDAEQHYEPPTLRVIEGGRLN